MQYHTKNLDNNLSQIASTYVIQISNQEILTPENKHKWLYFAGSGKIVPKKC